MKRRLALLVPCLSVSLFTLMAACGSGNDSAGEGGTIGAADAGGDEAGHSGGGAMAEPRDAAASPRTPPPPIGPNAIFSGRLGTTEKLEASDMGPAQVYVGAGNPVEGLTVKSEFIMVSDDRLPLGTMWAFHIDIPNKYPQSVIFGWNFRENASGTVWKYYDASKFAGFSFWAKADSNFSFNEGLYIYDINSTSPSDGYGGTCTDPAGCAKAFAAGPIFPKGVAWRRYTYRFAEVLPAGMNITKLGRVDLFHLRIGGGPASQVWITGIQMLTPEDLAAQR